MLLNSLLQRHSYNKLVLCFAPLKAICIYLNKSAWAWDHSPISDHYLACLLVTRLTNDLYSRLNKISMTRSSFFQQLPLLSSKHRTWRIEGLAPTSVRNQSCANFMRLTNTSSASCLGQDHPCIKAKKTLQLCDSTDSRAEKVPVTLIATVEVNKAQTEFEISCYYRFKQSVEQGSKLKKS